MKLAAHPKPILRPVAMLAAALLLLAATACGRHPLTSYVNPLVGTDGHGHTFPGAIVPFGQVQPSPDTRLSGWDGCSGYHFSDDSIYGFSHTHLSGTGVEDYGDVLLMPIFTGEASLPLPQSDYRSHFSHAREVAQAGYYKVHLDDPNVDVELTADRRVAYHRYRFNDAGGMCGGKSPNIILDLRHRDVLLSGGIMQRDSLIVGWRESSAWNPDQHLFFAISVGTSYSLALSADSTQALIVLPDQKEVELRVAISGVDIDGAITNLRAARYKDFNAARSGADSTWEAALGKLEVKGGSKEQKCCFYTALYHCMTAPYLWNDADGRYWGFDNKVHAADVGREVYTVFSLWDTYRALHPLLTRLEPERTVDFVYSAMKQFEQMGELPMWPLAAHETHCMVGYHAAPMLLEAYVGLAAPGGTLAGYTPQQLLAAMVATSNRTPEHLAYAEQGYLSSEVDNESVSKTLEYAYDDWCIAQMAGLAGDTATERQYWLRSQSWQNLMDEQGFMRARRNGGFVTPFDPTEVNNHYTEANAWQYSTYVPHDIEAWVSRLGGREKALALLDSLFEGHSQLSGRNQSDITGLVGMYAHGNEPSHHAAWLYTLLGRPEKTAHWVRYILDSFYSSRPDGLCGNEDCGQMSAWYVLASLGQYEVCPGSGVWVTTDPIFSCPQFAPPTGDAGRKRQLVCPDSLRLTPCPAFADWRMQSTRDRTTDTVACWPGLLPSPAVRHIEVRPPTGRRARYLIAPAPQYTENGAEGMVDNIFGTPNYRIGGWQGWQSDMEAIVEFDHAQAVRSVGVDCLENMRSWIFFPRKVEVEYSTDGQTWHPYGETANTLFPPVHTRQEESVTHTFTVGGNAVAKQIKVKVKNFGALPQWHISAGEQAWVFVDEITINRK